MLNCVCLGQTLAQSGRFQCIQKKKVNEHRTLGWGDSVLSCGLQLSFRFRFCYRLWQFCRIIASPPTLASQFSLVLKDSFPVLEHQTYQIYLDKP